MFLPILLINFRLQYEGTLKYLGRCHRHRKGDTEFGRWFMCYWNEARHGCWWMHRQVSWTLLHMCKAFPPKKGEQTIVMSFNVTAVLLTLREVGYIREHA